MKNGWHGMPPRRSIPNPPSRRFCDMRRLLIVPVVCVLALAMACASQSTVRLAEQRQPGEDGRGRGRVHAQGYRPDASVAGQQPEAHVWRSDHARRRQFDDPFHLRRAADLQVRGLQRGRTEGLHLPERRRRIVHDVTRRDRDARRRSDLHAGRHARSIRGASVPGRRAPRLSPR